MDTLLNEVKDYLRITWDDEDKVISSLILEAKQYLKEKTGTAIDFSKDLVALSLLKDYCRYIRNYSKEYFEKNFLNELLHLQLKYSVKERNGSKVLITEEGKGIFTEVESGKNE